MLNPFSASTCSSAELASLISKSKLKNVLFEVEPERFIVPDGVTLVGYTENEYV